jgi:hypothetical protein
MQIYTLEPSLIEHGEESFRECIRQYLGSSDMLRCSGVAVIPGAIAATIRAGITDEREICRIVARVSRQREATVKKVLVGLADQHIAGRLWHREPNGEYRSKGQRSRTPAAIMLN